MDIQRRRAARLGLPEPEDDPEPANLRGMSLGEIIRASRERRPQAEAGPRYWTETIKSATMAALRNNNTGVGRDFIVPLTVEVVPPQVNLRHLRIRDFDPRRISPVINFRMDSQPFPCGGSGNQTDDHFQTGEGLPSPVLADEGEQAVFNLVPFAGPRRKVAHCDGQSGLVGQFLQL